MYHWGSAERHFEVNECDLTGSNNDKIHNTNKYFIGPFILGSRWMENKKPCILKFDRISGKTWDMRRK